MARRKRPLTDEGLLLRLAAQAPPDFSHIAEPLRGLAVPIASLVPDPANARRHPERNLAAVRASLAAYGQRKPLVVRRSGMIVEAGNGTLEAARALGWSHVAAVLVDDDAVAATGFALADNRSAELAEWDEAALGDLLAGLRAEDVDLGGLGWDEEEAERLLGAVPAFDPTAEDEQGDLDHLAPKLCPHCGKDIRDPPG